MILPIGNTIKFWLNGVETFNEKVEPQMKRTPFYQKYNSGDVVRVQVQNSVPFPYKLQLVDCDGGIITTVDFVQAYINGRYVYDIVFTFASLGVTNTKVKLNIIASVFSTEISGNISGFKGSVSGNIVFSSGLYELSGGVGGFIAAVDGQAILSTSAMFKLSNNVGDICAKTLVTKYFSGAFTIGTVLYMEPELTNIQTGFDYAVEDATGTIYTLDPVYGEIGVDTGLDC